MTERRGDHGFTVAPQRLGGDGGGPGRSRIRRIGFALFLALAAAIFTIGWLGPRLSDRPSFDVSFFATPLPSITPSPSPTHRPLDDGQVLATPLPFITRPEGPVPSGQVAVVTDAFRVLDLASGEISTGLRTTFWRDAIFEAVTGGGWTCICFGEGLDFGAGSVPVRIVGIGPNGTPTDTTDLADLPNSFENGQSGVTIDVDTLDDGRRGLLAIATRHGESWRFTVSPVDVVGRRLGSSVLLAEVAVPPRPPVPSPRPSVDPSIPDQDEVYVDGPHVRVAPNGRVAFVWGFVQRYNASVGEAATKGVAWRVALGADGSIESVKAAPGLLTAPAYCSAIAFASADRLAWICPHPGEDPAGNFDGNWQFGTLDLDGRRAGTTELKLATEGYVGAPLFDRANGKAYLWDATALTITRIDAHSLVVEQSTFDPLAESSTGLAPGAGSAPVDWHDVDSAVRQNGVTTFTGGLNGERLYAVGFDPASTSDSGSLPSRGIFAIDRSTLALVDRWAPAANYLAVTALPGGLVAAAGTPGIGTDGHFAPWEASLTIYDEADGRILVRFGQLGADTVALVVDR